MDHSVGKKRAAGVGPVKPILNIRGREEAVHDELTSSGEKAQQVYLAFGAEYS